MVYYSTASSYYIIKTTAFNYHQTIIVIHLGTHLHTTQSCRQRIDHNHFNEFNFKQTTLSNFKVIAHWLQVSGFEDFYSKQLGSIFFFVV